MADRTAQAWRAGGDAVPVRFSGGGTGAAPLSWGQQSLWRVMRDKHTWLPIGAWLPLPPGTTVADAAADLEFLMSHYPGLRTRLRFDADGPTQVVAAAGKVDLEVVDAPDDADPGAVAEQVWRRYADADYDFVTEWPVRMAVIRHRGALTHRVWVMCHLVTDGTGANVMLGELRARDASGSAAADSPLEQARWQRSLAGQRHCARALRHWEQILRGVPPRRFPPREPPSGPRYWQAAYASPAMHLAVRAICARTGVEAASVLLAVFAVALARTSGANPVVVQVVVSNRFRPGLARTVSPIIQNGLCAVEVTDTTIDETVAHTRRRAMAAYKNAYYDPDQRDELVARVGRERGEPVDIDCFFNDRRLRQPAGGGPPPTPEQIRAAVGSGSFQWRYKQDFRQFDQLFVNVDDVPDTVAMTVLTDIHRLCPVALESAIRAMEEIAVAAAVDPATRTGVTQA
jgi:hypothetical protein